MAIELPIRGMTCDACVRSLEKVFEREGLAGVTVELGRARVPDSRAEEVARVKKAIEKAGFEVEP